MSSFDQIDAADAVASLGFDDCSPAKTARLQAIAMWHIADLLADGLEVLGDIAAILDGMRDDALEARGKDRTDI